MIKSHKKSFWQNYNIVTWVSMTEEQLKISICEGLHWNSQYFNVEFANNYKTYRVQQCFSLKTKMSSFSNFSSKWCYSNGSPPNFSHFWAPMWSTAAWQPIPDIGLPQQHNSPKCWSQKEEDNPMMSMCREQKKGSNSPILMQKIDLK